MTDREREFAKIGFEHSEGIDSASVIIVPNTGRIIKKLKSGRYECQPYNDNYYKEFDDLLEADKFATGKGI